MIKTIYKKSNKFYLSTPKIEIHTKTQHTTLNKLHLSTKSD